MNLSSLWTNLVKENPMMAEVGRFRRRYLSFQGPTTVLNGGLGLLLVAFAIYSVVCIYWRGELDPFMPLYIFLVFALFAVPLLLHATIAGERERRSWDMLMVAPITHAQIIMGKFAGAFLGLTLTFGVFMIPALINMIYHHRPHWGEVLVGCLVIIAQLASVIAMTILISARVRRPLTALGVSLAAILVYFMFVPGFIASIGGYFSRTVIMSMSPFGLLASLSMYAQSRGQYYDSSTPALNVSAVVVTNLIFETFLTVVLLAWAVKTLSYADNEVKFLSKQKRHA